MTPKENLFLDFGLLTPVLALLILGLTTLFSIQVSFFRSQLIFVVVSFFVYFIFSQISISAIKFYSLPIYIVSIILLSIIFLIGVESKGAVRWIDILGIRIQFSEVLKPFLAVALSSYLANLTTANFKSFVKLWILMLPILVLIYMQPDLGNTMLYTVVAFFTLLVFGYPMLWFGTGIFVILLFSPIAWQFLHEYQRQRILTFFHPSKDPLGSSYNVIQSIIAVGSGMFFGKGMLEVTQSRLRFLPERHTDFIFATFSEGFGFIGVCILLIAFFFLFFNIYKIFTNTKDNFYKIFTVCCFFLFLIPLLVNIGMNIGIMPITGVTLPFLSYGGSSLLSNFIILGFLSAIKRNMKNKEVLEIR